MHVLSGNEERSKSLLEPKRRLQKWPRVQPEERGDVAVKGLDDVIEVRALRAEEFYPICIDTRGV